MRHLEGMDIDMRSPSAFIFSALAFSSLVLVASALAEEPAGKPDGNSVVIEGEASYYGGEFHGKKTANGEIFDQSKMTAASKELPLGSKATVTNEETGKSVELQDQRPRPRCGRSGPGRVQGCGQEARHDRRGHGSGNDRGRSRQAADRKGPRESREHGREAERRGPEERIPPRRSKNSTSRSCHPSKS